MFAPWNRSPDTIRYCARHHGPVPDRRLSAGPDPSSSPDTGGMAQLIPVEDPADERLADVVSGSRRLLILEELVNHTNIGAIFRCAAALGVHGIVLSPRCADPLYRRSIKVSMGAVFAIPYARMTDWYGGLAEIRSAGY